jgi:alpha-tubulin suppressor-like RCC1 family protein
VGIGAGDGFTCALLASGTVVCWGDNRVGELGTGVLSASELPGIVPGLEGIEQLVVGRSHSCARTVHGDVSCWGSNGYSGTRIIVGTLGRGDGALDHQPNATRIPSLSYSVTSLTGGSNAFCARTRTGATRCWGAVFPQVSFPQPIASNELLLSPVAVASVQDGADFTCLSLGDGSAWCGGANDHGQLATGTFDAMQRDHFYAVNLPGGRDPVHFEQVSASTWGQSACAVDAYGVLRCWGRGDHGQLGNDSVSDSASAQPVLFVDPKTLAPIPTPTIASVSGQRLLLGERQSDRIVCSDHRGIRRARACRPRGDPSVN